VPTCVHAPKYYLDLSAPRILANPQNGHIFMYILVDVQRVLPSHFFEKPSTPPIGEVKVFMGYVSIPGGVSGIGGLPHVREPFSIGTNKVPSVTGVPVM